VNAEPEKHTDWQWMAWTEFLKQDKHFVAFKYMLEQGYGDINKLKKAIE